MTENNLNKVNGKLSEMTESKKENSELSSMKQQLKSYEDTLKQLQADFENYKKRNDKDLMQAQMLGKLSLVKEILPILDTMIQMEGLLKLKGPFESLHENEKGVIMIIANFRKTLEGHGLKEIPCAVGMTFDPFTMEATIQQKIKGKVQHEVLEIIQKGYYFYDNIIRTTKVVVGE